MAAYNKTIITAKGQALIAKSMVNTDVSFTKVVTSDKDYTSKGNLENLTDIENIKQSELVSEVKVLNKTAVQVIAAFSNSLLTTGYYLRTIGLYATDPDEGEILYSITTALVPDWIPPFGNISITSFEVKLETIVSNSGNIDLNVSPTAVVNVSQFKEFKEQVVSQLSDLANPNILINGGFIVNQRGKKTYNDDVKYSVDRWLLVTRGGSLTTNGDSVTFSGLDSDLYINQILEEKDTIPLLGKKVTLSFLIKGSNLTKGDFFIQIREHSGTDDISKKIINYSEINNEYEKIIVTTQLSSNNLNQLQIVLGTFSTFGEGNFNTGATISIKNVKLELDAKATPFVPRPYGEELILCQRYYEKSYGDGLYPVEGQADFANVVIVSQSELEDKNISFRVEKRVSPTLKVYSPNTGKEGKVASWIKNGSEGSKYYDITYRGHYVGTKMMAIQSFNVDSPVTGTVTSARFHWIADAEIY